MKYTPTASMPLGIVIRKSPGVTRWVKWNWHVVAVLPGAAPAVWRELRRDGEAVEYHAATVDLELWRGEAESYLTGLSTRQPSVYVILSQSDGPHGVDVLLATVSPYEAQDYADSGEEQVEQVPMPEAMMAWVREFVDVHYQEERFVKRKRDKKRVDLVQDGVGDARISGASDVFRAPASKKAAIH